MRYALPLLVLIALPSAASAQANAIVPDPDPEIERKSFLVAPGFEVSLYAADPLLAKPIQMNFDPRGRLWVASSEIYPQIKPGEAANDKILILEDKDGDGKADTTTVFADGLLIPTGVEPGDGGAYVANSTELVHLSASKPGGKADRSRVLLSGFGTEDTHHILHTFRWGPDQALYFNQSIYIHSHLETPHGVKRLNGGGIWRFRPDTYHLDVFARGWVNTWGHSFDRYGQSFVTDGAGGEGINHGIPGGAYMWAVGQSRILHGMNPGSPKYCGVEVVDGRHLPADWQGNVITNDFRGHRVCRFVLRDAGSTFESREMTEVIKTNHPAFRPIDVKMGPDGAIYVADWYNPIIQHGEVDFRDPRRDKTHGRIWRITAKDRPLVPRPKLADATVPELLDQLKSPEGWTRQQAKRVLKERGKDAVLPALKDWVCDTDEARLEAAWVYQSFGFADEDTLNSLVASKDGRIRAAAVRILSQTILGPLQNIGRRELRFEGPDWARSVARAATDEHPRVRLEAVRALSRIDAAEAAMAALDRPMDPYLDYALWLTVRESEPRWLPAFKKGELTFGGDPKKIAFALEASGSPDAVAPVVTLVEGGTLPKERTAELWLLLARIGGPAEVQKVIARAADANAASDGERNALMQAVEESVRRRKVGRPADPQPLASLLTNPSKPAAHAAMRLVGFWKLDALRPSLKSAGTSDDIAAAFEAVALFGDAKAKETLAAAAADKDAAVRRAAIAALVTIDPPAAAAKAVEYLSANDPGTLFAAFLAQKGGPAALAKALAGQTLPADAAKLGLRAIRATTVKADELAAALTKAGGLGAAKKEPTADEVKALIADAAKGDPARGEVVFRRKDLQCLNCHAIAGAGGQVGPDMTSIGASAQPDYLVESLLIPNKAVKEGYHAVEANTLAGKVVAGVKVRETPKEIVLRTAEDAEVTIARDDIDGPVKNARSLMPDGLTDTLTKQEFADLTRFLSELGKVGGYAPNPKRLVRRWQVIEPTGENMNRFRRTRVGAAAETPEQFAWTPVYAKVSGDLPLSDIPKAAVWNDTAPQTVVRFQLDATAAGPAKLAFNSVAGLTLFVGPAAAEAKPETPIDVVTGRTFVTIVIDRTKRTDDLRIELLDVPGSSARVAVAGGK